MKHNLWKPFNVLIILAMVGTVLAGCVPATTTERSFC